MKNKIWQSIDEQRREEVDEAILSQVTGGATDNWIPGGALLGALSGGAFGSTLGHGKSVGSSGGGAIGAIVGGVVGGAVGTTAVAAAKMIAGRRAARAEIEMVPHFRT